MDKKMMATSTAMLLLKLLEEEDMYGYQMIRKLEERSNQVFSLKEGTLYPILHSLEEQEAVESYEHQAETGRMRKYYRLTEKGTKLLQQKREEWEAYEKAIHDVMSVSEKKCLHIRRAANVDHESQIHDIMKGGMSFAL